MNIFLRGLKVAVVLIVLTGFIVGMAAASSTDILIESGTKDKISNSNLKSYIIPKITDHSRSLVYEACINPGSDVDWFKTNVNSGDKIIQYLSSSARSGFVSMNGIDDEGNLVDQVSKLHGYDGDGIVKYPPFYTKVKNDKSKVYSGYEFFLKRN